MARTTLVLIRGLARESGHWGPFPPALRAALPDADVVTVDLPGTGTQLHARSPDTMSGLAEAARDQLVGRAGDGGPLVLFGISLGGMVVLEWAARHPREVAGVVVAASSAPGLSRAWQRFSWRGAVMIVRARVERDPERRQGHVAAVVMNRDDLRAEAVRQWGLVERVRPILPRTLRAQLTAAARWRVPSSLAMPSLFLVGEGDRLVHPACSRALARRFGAPLAVHPTAGHDVTTDETAWVVEQVRRFPVLS